MKSALPKSPSHKFLTGAPTQALESHAGSKKPQLSRGPTPSLNTGTPTATSLKTPPAVCSWALRGVRIHT